MIIDSIFLLEVSKIRTLSLIEQTHNEKKIHTKFSIRLVLGSYSPVEFEKGIAHFTRTIHSL